MTFKIKPSGDANFWTLFKDDDWAAQIQWNGELMEAEQMRNNDIITTALNRAKNKVTMKESGLRYVACIGRGEHILQDPDGKYELWMANKNHPAYGIIFKTTHLEFVRTATYQDLKRII